MPALIKDGAILEDSWLPVDNEVSSTEKGRILSLTQWLSCADKRGTAVQIETSDDPAHLFDYLDQLALIAVYFPVFTDGRGFSHGRALREQGFSGELRATGHFIRDQLTYLRRVGFNAFVLNDPIAVKEALGSLADFSEHYQAAYDQPMPLFRRR